MRINFEFQIGLPNIPQRTREIVCAIKGHNYRDYEGQKYSYMELFWLGSSEPDKECDRCGKKTYKKRVGKTEPIKIKRHSKLPK